MNMLPNKTAFTIEKAIPIPDEGGRKPKYPWRELEVGDSFFVPISDETTVRQESLSGGAVAAAKRTGMKFATRVVDGGVRVWRVK